MRILSSVRSLSYCYSYCISYITRFSFSSSSSSAPVVSPVKGSNSNPLIVDYLIDTLGFSKAHALSASHYLHRVKDLEKPQSVVRLLQQLGFTETHIRTAVQVEPRILLANVKKILEPKLRLFQELGLTGPDLGHFISINATLLTYSLDRKLIPCIEIFKKVLSNGADNRGLIQVLRRCKWITRYPDSRLLPNISFLESCGIIGSQVTMLLKRQPTLFAMKPSNLRERVHRVMEMGFSADSRMLVHALYTVSCMSQATLERKFNLFQSFGFSKDECMSMFRRNPGLFRTSEEKLKSGLEFYLYTVGFERKVLVYQPTFLMNSLEKRVIPRYRVLSILKSKKLLKKNPSFAQVLLLSDEVFKEKFIAMFINDAEELLIAYKGESSDSSDE